MDHSPGTCNWVRACKVVPFPCLEEASCSEDCSRPFSCACEGCVSWTVGVEAGEVPEDVSGRYLVDSMP